MKRILLVMLMLPFVSNLSYAAELSGIVKSAAGEPLAGVKIMCGRSLKNNFVVTEREGFFSFAERCGVIFFQCEGFHPLVKIVESSVRSLDVVLEDGTTTWIVPACSPETVKQDIGLSLRMRPPRKAQWKQGHDVDYGYFSIVYKAEGQQGWLKGVGDGPYASLGVPDEDLLLQARSFSVRAFKSARREGLDVRGQSADGTYWRFVGIMLREQMLYRGVSATIAAYFDKMIDGACAR